MHASGRAGSSFGPLFTLIIVLLFIYFVYHAVSGERGVISFIDLSKKVSEAKSELDVVSAERLRLEHRVTLLRDESLDLDLLDEQARRLLGYVGQDETVYLPDN